MSNLPQVSRFTGPNKGREPRLSAIRGKLPKGLSCAELKVSLQICADADRLTRMNYETAGQDPHDSRGAALELCLSVGASPQQFEAPRCKDDHATEVTLSKVVSILKPPSTACGGL